ncbi:hypothetical protein GGI20_004738 [Coemansia sp. BCRC 34301]|nr:hypothetical protein GGI20_004738 [Coemansia sp. BCRC 34301]
MSVDGCKFPLVRVLTLCTILDDHNDVSDREDMEEGGEADKRTKAGAMEWVRVRDLYGTIDPRGIDANISAFVQLVKEIMPMLNEVRVEDLKNFYTDDIRRYADRMIHVFWLANRVEYTDTGLWVVPLVFEIDGICQLMHIKCKYMGKVEILSRLLVTLKPFAPAIGASRYQRPLHSCLSPFRLFATQSSTKASSDIQKTALEEVRLLQQADESIPWYRLAAKHHLPIDEVQSVYAQAEDGARQRQQQSVRVTRTVEQHFDSTLGRCNWNVISSEVGLPPIECLDLFDVSASTIKPRSLIDTTGDWSKADVDELMQFVAAHFTDSSAVDWRLAGAFMNVDSLECQRIGQGTINGLVNAVAYRRICEYRESGQRWKDIHQHFQQYPTYILLRSRFHCHKRKLEGRLVTKYATEWTDAERKRTKEIVRQHQASMATPELVDVVQRELPHKPADDIFLIVSGLRYRLRFGRMTNAQMNQLLELVAEYGEDWDRIGQELDVLPSRALRNWEKYCESDDKRVGWSFDDALQLQHLTEAGVKPKEAAKLLGTKSQRACQVKAPFIRRLTPRHRGDVCLKAPWAKADGETLLKMVDESTMSTAAKWEQISKVLGRSVDACRLRFSHLKRNRKQNIDGCEHPATGEARKQLESGSIAVDWLQVSQATGPGIRECLEQSQYDVGKTCWNYDPDSFLQSTADRMTSFIKEHYPAPTPVNYRAVSNYLWIDMDDCICIHDMLQGKFKWTKVAIKRAADLRAQGLTFKEIARRLSPTLSSGTRPYYQAKLRSIDFNDLASRIASGQTTVKLAAKEFGVPWVVLECRMQSMSGKLYSSRWSEEETRKLVDYVQGCKLKPDLVYFSKLLGTKSYLQCHTKLIRLKRKGVLPFAKYVN